MTLPGASLALALVAVAISVVAFVVLFAARKPWARLVPGWIAAAALGPVLATFFAVRGTIDTFQGMSTSGGGIGAISAGMWEAGQPLLWSLYTATLLGFATVGCALRAASDDDEDEGDSGAMPLALTIVATLLWLVPFATFRSINLTIIRLVDPRQPQTGSIAEASMDLARRLTFGAASAALATLLLGGVIVLAAAFRGKSPRAASVRAIAFVALLSALTTAGATWWLHGWLSQLRQTAISGQFPG